MLKPSVLNEHEMEYSTAKILRQEGLKKTRLRLALLKVFLHAKNAQSYLDIREKLGDKVDKSTLYRNLSAFEKAGIVHRINDQSGISKYAFGKVNDLQGNHAHFVCDNCQAVYCMERNTTIKIDVPKGFKTTTIQTLIRGVCSDC